MRFDFAGCGSDPVWVPLRDSVIDEWVEPHHLKRCSTALEQAFALMNQPGGFDKHVAEQREEEDALTEEDKMRVMENYLSSSYEDMSVEVSV